MENKRIFESIRGRKGKRKKASSSCKRGKKKDVSRPKWVRAVQRYTYEQIMKVKDCEISWEMDSINMKIFNRRIMWEKCELNWRSDIFTRRRGRNDPLITQFRSLLNRLSPDNMKNVIKKLEDLVNPNTCVMLAKMLLEKSALEPKYVYVYAALCNNLIKVCGNFRKDLLCQCQQLFDEYAYIIEQQKQQDKSVIIDKKKFLGLIQTIGELYVQKVISPKRIILCCQDLMEKYNNVVCIEAVCYLLSICKQLFNSSKSDFKLKMNRILENLRQMMPQLIPRIRFKILDLIERGELKELALINSDKM